MYYIKNQNRLQGKKIKNSLIVGYRTISDETITDVNNKIIIVTEDNGVFVTSIGHALDNEDSDDEDELYLSCFSEYFFKKYVTDKKMALRYTLINQFNISASEIDKYAEEEARLRDEKEAKQREKQKKKEIQKANIILRNSRKEFIDKYKNNIHVGDMVEISNPQSILANCSYAVYIKKGMDADFDEDIVDVGLSRVFLVDTFKNIYNKKVKVLKISKDGVFVDTSDIPDDLCEDASYWDYEFLKPL